MKMDLEPQQFGGRVAISNSLLPKCTHCDINGSCITSIRMKLSKEEKEILQSVEEGRWRSVPDVQKQVRRYRDYAKATVRKDKRVNIRMSEKDFVRFQKKALEQGLPYQTLISSVLHKYVNGHLVDKAS
jgi:predicted DNA binding CopG/RHH family protein